MLDARARRLLAPTLDRIAERLDGFPMVTPNRLTGLGAVLGVTGAVSAARAWWWLALLLWWASRLADGLDGPLARCAAQPAPLRASGGFLDIMADFLVYGAFVVGVEIGAGGSATPFLLVLLAYYLNGSAFLAFSSIAERRQVTIDDGRSLSFIGGLAEGTETIAVHSLWCVLPMFAGAIAWVWAGVVFLSAAYRVVAGYSRLRPPAA